MVIALKEATALRSAVLRTNALNKPIVATFSTQTSKCLANIVCPSAIQIFNASLDFNAKTVLKRQKPVVFPIDNRVRGLTTRSKEN